ncbi:hypothetical protein MKX01_035382 [Papaver californicum]|nr:hypothetical protein MKX01_035382 [Papaver californicum]
MSCVVGTNLEDYNFYKHFSLPGSNKESDYDAFLSDLTRRPMYTCINSEACLLRIRIRLSTGCLVFYKMNRKQKKKLLRKRFQI